MRDQWDESEGREQRFLRPESREHRRRRPWAASRAGRAGLWLLLAGAIAGTTLLVRHAVFASPRLAVRKVTFEGDRRTSPELLAAVARALRGRSVLEVDLVEVEERLRRDGPWVGSVTVHRALPGRIDVHLTELKPAARLEDGLHLLTEEGRIVPAVPAQDGDDELPLVAGAGATSPQALARVVELLGYLRGGKAPLAPRLERLNASDPEDLVLRLVDTPFDVHVGSDEFVSRLNRFLNAEPVLRARYSGLTSVDLRFRDRVVVAPVETGPRSRADLAAPDRSRAEVAAPKKTSPPVGG